MLLFKLKTYLYIGFLLMFAPLLIVADYVGWNLFMAGQYEPRSFKGCIEDYKKVLQKEKEKIKVG